jgi:hypothetical protein
VNYVYGALSGAIAQAVMLDRAGYHDVWEWEDRAIYRAYEWLFNVADFPPSGDDTFQLPLLDAFCGTSRWDGRVTHPGKALGFTEFTHHPSLAGVRLTVLVVGTGSVTRIPDRLVYAEGEVVELYPSPGSGFVFTGWSGGASGNDVPLVLVLSGDATNVTATFEDVLPPEVILLGPSDGDDLTIGTTVPVRWNASDNGAVVTVDVELSRSGPLGPFEELLSGLPDTGSWNWTVSGPATNDAWIRVTARDAASLVATDLGESPFTIHEPAPAPGSILLEELASGTVTASLSVSTSSPLAMGEDCFFVASIATRPATAVTSVAGLGLVWERIDSQCSGWRQTAVEVWVAHGTPTLTEIVSAHFQTAPISAAIAAARYSGVESRDPVALVISGNANGVEGICVGGKELAAYSLPLATSVPGELRFTPASFLGTPSGSPSSIV